MELVSVKCSYFDAILKKYGFDVVVYVNRPRQMGKNEDNRFIHDFNFTMTHNAYSWQQIHARNQFLNCLLSSINFRAIDDEGFPIARLKFKRMPWFN